MRDALAASIKAFMHYKPKLQQVEEEAKARGFKGPIEEAKIMVIQGVNINEALRTLEKKMTTDKQRVLTLESLQKDKDLDSLREKVKELIEQQSKLSSLIIELQTLIERKNSEIRELRERLREEREKVDFAVRKDRKVEMLNDYVKRLESMIKKLESDVTELRERLFNYENIASKIEKGDLVVVKKVENATFSSVKKAIELKKLRNGELIYLENPVIFDEDGLNEIVKLEPKMIIFIVKPADWLLNFFRSQALPVYLIDETSDSVLKLVWIGETPFIDKEKVLKMAEEEKERLKNEKLRQMRESLERLIEEYKKRNNR